MKQGKPADAEPLLRTALEIEERVLGRNHPIVATVYSNLGVSLKQRRRFAEATPYYVKALQIRRHILGPN